MKRREKDGWVKSRWWSIMPIQNEERRLRGDLIRIAITFETWDLFRVLYLFRGHNISVSDTNNHCMGLIVRVRKVYHSFILVFLFTFLFHSSILMLAH